MDKRLDLPAGEWPFVPSFDPRNAVRLPPYHRLNVRINRYFQLESGRLSLFVCSSS